MELDDRPLSTSRPPARRFFGSCRDFALLLCTALRCHDVPARLRCGFAAYWAPDVFVDHWVCEYWDAQRQRWLLADPEIGTPERERFQITFDETDVPRDQFIASGRAWQMCCRREADPTGFGVPEIGITGLWFVRANLPRDLAALNRIELLPWDYTEFGDRRFRELSALTPEAVRLLDQLAEITGADPVPFPLVTELYRDTPQVQVADTVRSDSVVGARMVSVHRSR